MRLRFGEVLGGKILSDLNKKISWLFLIIIMYIIPLNTNEYTNIDNELGHFFVFLLKFNWLDLLEPNIDSKNRIIDDNNTTYKLFLFCLFKNKYR